MAQKSLIDFCAILGLYHVIPVFRVFRGAKSCNSSSKNAQSTLLGGIWSSVRFQVFIDKQSILATVCRLRGKSFSTTTSIKDSTKNILQDEKQILSRWREYFKNLLNPVRAAPTDTCDAIDFVKEEVLALTEVTAAIRGLKSTKAAGEDEIRPEMLKALNGEGVRLLTKVCQVA